MYLPWFTWCTCERQGTTFRILSFHHGNSRNDAQFIKLGSKLYSLSHLACSKHLLLKAVFWTLLNIFKMICLVIQCQRSRNPKKFLVLLEIFRNVHKCFKEQYTICLIILFHSVETHIMIYKLRQHESTPWSCSQKFFFFFSGSYFCWFEIAPGTFVSSSQNAQHLGILPLTPDKNISLGSALRMFH